MQYCVVSRKLFREQPWLPVFAKITLLSPGEGFRGLSCPSAPPLQCCSQADGCGGPVCSARVRQHRVGVFPLLLRSAELAEGEVGLREDEHRLHAQRHVVALQPTVRVLGAVEKK